MKARASPLKADHSILPVERSPLETNGDGISSPKKGPFSGDGLSSNAHNGGNLSDSSSGESRCGLRKKRSQSPSRVRFEDESTQEAEVRYQLRRKCGLESWVRRGPRGSIPKPGLPAYGFPGKERALKADPGDAGMPCCKNAQVRGTGGWRGRANPVTNGEAGERPHNVHTAICIDGKCSCCGSYIISDSKACGLDPPSYEFPDVGVVPQGRKPYTPGRHELPVDTARGVGTNLDAEAPDVGSLPLRVIPCWVLPSQHRIRIEPIKETYIGEVTSIDGVSLIEAGDTNASSQDNSAEMKDTTGAKGSADCDAIVSGSYSDGRTADNIEPNAKGTDQPRRCIRENSVVTEPVSTAADCKSKSRRKTIERKRDCARPIQCQREEPESDGQWSRSSADSKPVASASVSKHRHITSQSTEQVTELSLVSEQQPAALPPASTSDQSSKQIRESSTLHCPSLPQRKGIRCLGNGQLKDIPSSSHSSSSHSQDGSRIPASHPTLAPEFMEKTFSRHPLPKRLTIDKSSLTIPSNSQPCAASLTLKCNPLAQLGACPSPQYQLIHLDPQESDGRLSDSHAFRETSSLPPQRGPGGPDQQLPNGHARAPHAPGPAAHCPLSSALRLPRNTMTNGSSQSSESYRSGVGKSSQAANQLTDPNGGLLPPEHHELTKSGNCPTCPISPSPETVSSSERSGLWLASKHSAEKQSAKIETRPATVKKRPQDATSSREQPAPITASAPGEHRGSARPPQPGPKDGERLLPASCGERPTHPPESGPAEGDRGPAASESQPGAQHLRGGQHKSRSSLKSFFSTIGHSAVSKLSRLRSSSMEQINSRSTAETSGELRCEQTQGSLRKTPSLQSLGLVSPLAVLRKASSFQSLHSQKKKKQRCSSYLVGETAETGAGGSESKPFGCRPMRSLSVEDIGRPNQPRVIGRVSQTFPDASFMLELSKPAHGPFGFFISRQSDKSCGGIFIHQMADRNAEKLYAGLLELGDEILEVNGKRVDGLSFNEVSRVMLQGSTVSIRVRRHNSIMRQQEG